MAMDATVSSARVAETPAARALRIGFGGLWLLDAVLQAQPGMFHMDMVSTVMQPAATGQPAWLASTIAWSIGVVSPHVATFNALIVALQALIGVLLLMGHRPRAVRAGAVLALIWALAIWLFGEGLGQLLTGSATGLNGAPGSALVYAAGAGLLLAQRGDDLCIAGRSLATWLVAGLFALSVALQLNPLFFQPLGLASVFGQSAGMAQPRIVALPLVWLANASGARPVLVNAVAVALLAAAALAAPWTAHGRVGQALLGALTLFLLAEWWLGQDFGMPFGGMATDPNTAVPVALLLVAGYLADRDRVGRARACAGRAEHVPTQSVAIGSQGA